jgi:hypothetical protein
MLTMGEGEPPITLRSTVLQRPHYGRPAVGHGTLRAFVSPPFCIVIAYYFRGTRDDRESDDEGSA